MARAQRLVILFIFVLFWGSAGAADRHLLWQVQSDRATVYLLGAVHLGKADLYPLPKVMEEAFAASTTLVLELDPRFASAAAQKQVEQVSYPTGQTIADAIQPATFQRLKDYLKQEGIPLAMVERMRAGLLGHTLVVGELAQLGYSPLFGIDLHFATQAGERPIVELETVEEQIALLIGVPDEDAHIRTTLDDLENLEEKITRLDKAWREGDTATLEQVTITEPMRKHPSQRPYLDKMVFQRNRRMAEKIRGFLGQQGSWFVAVGAGHLLGEQGIVELLRKEGYRVEQL